MFERYTENARRTIFFARNQAVESGSSFIEPEHICLGLLEDRWLTNDLLKDAHEVRAEILAGLQGLAKTGNSVDLPLSDKSKMVLRYGAEEADALLDPHIGNEHLLLGLLRQKPSTVAGLLARRDIRLESLRVSIKQISREARKAKSGDQTARWRAAGVPEGYSRPRVLYNAASESVILEVQNADKKSGPTRLLVRHKDAEVYEPIGSPEEEVSYESAITCETRPIVVFNSMHRTKTGGGNWVGVNVFDLMNRSLTVCVSKQNLAVPAPYSGGWIAELLRLSDDACHVYVKAGLEMRHENGAKMDYYVARMDLKSGQLELVSHLKNVWL